MNNLPDPSLAFLISTGSSIPDTIKAQVYPDGSGKTDTLVEVVVAVWESIGGDATIDGIGVGVALGITDPIVGGMYEVGALDVSPHPTRDSPIIVNKVRITLGVFLRLCMPLRLFF
jgi:hypothetical protein